MRELSCAGENVFRKIIIATEKNVCMYIQLQQ